MILSSIKLLYLLLAAHFVADFSLQSNTMGTEKRRSSTTELQKIVPWYWWLTGHAMTHGFLTWAVLGLWLQFPGAVYIAMAETIAHWVIDFGKCEGDYGLKVDQALHLVCKIMWVSYVTAYLSILFR